MHSEPSILLLHGLGETPASYQELIDRLETRGWPVLAPHLFSVREQSSWSINACTNRVADVLGGSPAHIIGHSLGAIIALNLASSYPHLAKSLLLSAPQVKVARPLLALQKCIMQLLPEHIVAPSGLTKHEMVSVMKACTHIDLRSELRNIKLPVTIACGKHDMVNLHAAHTIHSSLAQSKLYLVPSAGHQWMSQQPHQAEAIIGNHIESIDK